MTAADSNQPFDGANALIFGGAKGIGKGVALEWARRGAKVAIADIDGDAANETADEIRQSGGSAVAVIADVTSDESMAAAVARAESSLGEIDIVMNNVGAALTGHPQDIPSDEWRRITELNYFGVLRSLELFIPKMLSRGHGHIVNTASFAGLYPYAISRIPYAAAKAAVIALSENLAIYLEPQGIRVTCLIPGPVLTDIMAAQTSWSKDCALVGPGREFRMLTPADSAVTLADGMRDGHILVPTHEEVWDTVKQWAESPDGFIRSKIDGYARGDLGRPPLFRRETSGDKRMTDKYARAGEIMRQMLSPENVAHMENDAPNDRFGGEFARLAYEHAYVAHWTRPGLSPRDRSLLTLGLLIGLRNERELRSHFAAALRNGLTTEELQEVIYHSTAYAGFPTASVALAVAAQVVAEEDAKSAG